MATNINSMDYTDDLKSVVDIYGEDINEDSIGDSCIYHK